jgi:hypothetical protein
MIGKKWMTVLAVAGATAVAGVSEARAHYTGKTPTGIAMMAGVTEVTPPVGFVAAKHTTLKKTTHSKVVKTGLKHKKVHHKLLKKTLLKKKTV